MPDEKKNYFGLLISVIGIIGSLLVYLNSYFHNNHPSLEKQEEIINFQENNNHQEENIKEINNVILLDNTIVNLIIFFLIFAIAVYFVYFSYLSPVVNNNSSGTIEKNPIKKTLNKSPFRREVLFEENERIFKNKKFYYLYDSNYKEKTTQNNNINVNELSLEEVKKIKFEQLKIRGIEDEIFFVNKNFKIENYRSQIIRCQKENVIDEKEINIDEIKQEFLYEERKENFLNVSAENKNISVIDYVLSDGDGKSLFLKNFFSESDVSHERYSKYLKGTLDYFNLSNIAAALFSFLFFLASFVVPFLVVYFIYALIYAFLEEVEENKFLFAFLKTLKALIFLNIRSFYKIIPILCFLGTLIFDVYLFFGKNVIKFIPIIYDKKAKRFMRFFYSVLSVELLLTGEVEITIDEHYDPYFFEEKKQGMSEDARFEHN